jgi:hypothetical protein
MTIVAGRNQVCVFVFMFEVVVVVVWVFLVVVLVFLSWSVIASWSVMNNRLGFGNFY